MQPLQPPSDRWTLNKQDFIQWAKWSLGMLAPSLIIFLNAYQAQQDLHYAWGMTTGSLISSFVYLLKKFQDN